MFQDFDWLEAMRTSPIMVVILLCSILTMGYALERFIYFWKRRDRVEGIAKIARERVREGDMADLAPPAFDQRHGDRVRPQRARRAVHGRARGQPFDGLQDERRGALDLQPADVRAGRHVSGVPGREGQLRDPVDAEGEAAAHVPHDSARPGRRSHQPQLQGILPFHPPRIFEACHGRGRVPEEIDRVLQVCAEVFDEGAGGVSVH